MLDICAAGDNFHCRRSTHRGPWATASCFWGLGLGVEGIPLQAQALKSKNLESNPEALNSLDL